MKKILEFKQSLFKNNNEAEIKKQISNIIDKKIKEIYKRYFPAVGKQIQYHVEKTQSNSKENKKKMVDIITTSKKLGYQNIYNNTNLNNHENLDNNDLNIKIEDITNNIVLITIFIISAIILININKIIK